MPKFTFKRKKNNKNNVNTLDTYISENEMKKTGCKTLAWICRILFIPMIILGLLVSLVEPSFGLGSIIIGVVEFVYSRKYFKRHKEEQRD